MDFLWMIALCITHIVCYYMGRSDGERHEPSEDAWIEIKKYEIDKRFEHIRWAAERKDHHEA